MAGVTSNATVGALPAPFGVTPYVVKPESIAYRVIIAAVIGPLIGIPICIVRLYTKQCILRNVGYDDYAIALATFLALGSSIVTGYQTRNGVGNHIWDVPAYKFKALMKLGDIAGALFYNLATLFIKVSLCLFYLRLSPFRNFRVAVYMVLVVSIIYSLLAAFGFAWVCHPIAKYWDFAIMTGYCINLNAFFLATAGINSATDLTLLVLPLFIIKDLRLPLRRKVGVAFLLMTGSFVCVVSMVRLQTVVKGMQTTTKDGTWGMVANFIWLLAEMWLGIICACLPALHAFMREHLNKDEDNGNVNLQVVRGRRTHRLGPNVASDSEAFDDGGRISSGPMDSDTEVRDVSRIRPMASEKSLLTSASRSDL